MVGFVSGKKEKPVELVRRLSNLEEDILRVEVYAEVEKTLREKGRVYYESGYWIEFMREANNLMEKRRDELQKQPEKEALENSLRLIIVYGESCTLNEDETIVDYPGALPGECI
ncbi:MAG: hypothetical protein AABW89_03240 [Nanoarchaeota archaeon]